MAAPRSTGRAIPDEADAVSQIAARIDPVLEMIIGSAVDIIDESGIKAVTVRSLARRTHYSSSTIGYHVSPIERFHTTLWQHIGAELIAYSMRPGNEGADDWAAIAATRARQWSDRHPARAQFLAVHHPDPTRAIRWDVFLGASRGLDLRDHDDLLHYLVRRLQAALEYLLTAPDPVVAEGLFADELRHALVWTQSATAAIDR